MADCSWCGPGCSRCFTVERTRETFEQVEARMVPHYRRLARRRMRDLQIAEADREVRHRRVISLALRAANVEGPNTWPGSGTLNDLRRLTMGGRWSQDVRSLLQHGFNFVLLTPWRVVLLGIHRLSPRLAVAPYRMDLRDWWAPDRFDAVRGHNGPPTTAERFTDLDPNIPT